MKLTSEEARKILEKVRLDTKDDKYDLFPEIKGNL